MSKQETGNCYDVSKFKLERANEDLRAAELMEQNQMWKAANNRAYYAVYHAIDAVLALVPIAFKRHKDTLSYFNKNYVHTGTFSSDIGRRIARLEEIRHNSDYNDFYIASKEEAEKQIETAKQVIELIEQYCKKIQG